MTENKFSLPFGIRDYIYRKGIFIDQYFCVIVTIRLYRMLNSKQLFDVEMAYLSNHQKKRYA